MPDLEKLVERFVRREVEFVIIGGYAAMIHGVSYVTFDVDVCCPLDLTNLQKIHAAVADLHPYHRMTPREVPFELTEGFERGLRNIYLKTDIGQIDCLGSLPDLGDYAFARAHSVEIGRPYGTCRLLDCETLIRAKETVGRPKDFLVTTELRAILDAQNFKLEP